MTGHNQIIDASSPSASVVVLLCVLCCYTPATVIKSMPWSILHLPDPGFALGCVVVLFLQSKDPNTGRTYYYHTGTRETRWTKPEEMDEGGLKTAKADSEGQGNFYVFCISFIAFSTFIRCSNYHLFISCHSNISPTHTCACASNYSVAYR